MTGIREAGAATEMSAAPEHVRVSVVGGRTQVDVALPLDIPVASLVPELVGLVRSRDVEASSETPWAATRDTFWTLSRLDPVVRLEPNQTLRGTGVVDGELLRLADERALSAPTLYDDVVDAAARLNKAAYAGWNAAAARWMSFVGLAVASLVWVYIVADVPNGAQHDLVVGLAAVVAAAMAGGATLAHRSYGRADVAAAVGWSAIPIVTGIVWTLLRGFGDFGVAVGCALLVVLNAACHRAIGTGRWGYLASGVLFAGSGLAMAGHGMGLSVQTVGAVLASAGALGCLSVSWLTEKLSRAELPVTTFGAEGEKVIFEPSFTTQLPPTESGAKTPSSGALPTAEAVWASVRAAAATRSALYGGLAVSVFCGAAAVLRAEPDQRWAGVALAWVCATALGVHARLPDSAAERVSLGVPAAALVVAGGISAFGGTAAMAWAGFGTLLAAAAVVSVVGLRVAGGHRPHRWAPAWAYLQYAAYGLLIPVALWGAGVYSQLEIR